MTAPSGVGDGMMAPTDMDPIAPPIEEAPPATPDAPYTPPPAPAPIAPRRPMAWPASHARDRRTWTVALAAALLIAVLGLGALYLDDTGNQATVRSLQTQNESLTGRTQNLQDQLNTTQANLTATLGELASTKAQLAHPLLTIWNVPQKISGPNYYLAGGVPDTFTYHLQATSTGPMNVSILTLEDWAKANACVTGGAGPTNYCMHHSGVTWSALGVTSINYDFHLAEGCADYVAVFTSASVVTVTPNVSVTYNPADHSTGACA